MAAKRRARRPRSDDSKVLVRNSGNAGSDEEDSGKSDETAMSLEPKEMPLKQAEQLASSPSPKDAGAQGSGEAFPGRSAPRGGAALKTKKTSSKRAKKAPPPSPEEDEAVDSADASPARDPLPDDTADPGHKKRAALKTKKTSSKRTKNAHPASPEKDEVGASADASPARDPLPDDTADTGHKKSAATAKQGEKRSRLLQQEEERPEKNPDGQTEKKPAVERSWSYDDELQILNALVMYSQSHNGALPDPSHLLANLTFDKIDANEDKLSDKIRKLRTRYHKLLSQGCTPSDDHGRRLFELSDTLWGQVDKDERVQPTSRDFSVLSKLYPHLAKEVKSYAETHTSGDLIMAMFMTIGDEKARDLDAKCKKQHTEAFKLEVAQANLTNELLSALV